MYDPVDPPPLFPSEELEVVSPPTRLQLRLHHFFAFTAVVAVFFALLSPALSQWSQRDVPKFLAALSVGWSMLYAFVLAAAATAVAYGVMWNRRSAAFFDQPGHWLLVEIGVMGVLGLISYALIWQLIAEDGVFSSAGFQIFQIYSVIIVVVDLALNIYIAWKICGERRWKAVFVIKGFAQLARSFRLVPIGSVLVGTSLVIAVVRDRRLGITRDAGHWLGVALLFAAIVLNLGSAGITALYMHFAR
jgi:hypothetical protein